MFVWRRVDYLIANNFVHLTLLINIKKMKSSWNVFCIDSELKEFNQK